MSDAPSSGPKGPASAVALHGVELVCPRCRGWRKDAWHQARLEHGDGCWICSSCDATFAVTDIGVHRIGSFAEDGSAARSGPGPVSVEVATWAANHFGMYAQPPLVDAQLGWLRALWDRLGELPAGPILVLGSATCGVVTALPADRNAICLEAHPGHLALAAQIAAGRTDLPYVTRPGAVSSVAMALPVAVISALQAAELVCANAVNPPFGPEQFAAIVCLNLVDSVPRPSLLLSQCEALVKPMGAVIVASPYNWHDDITPADERLDVILAQREDLEAAVESLVTGAIDPAYMARMRLQWSDRAVTWTLRTHDRMAVRFEQHAMALRKLPVAAATVSGGAVPAD